MPQPDLPGMPPRPGRRAPIPGVRAARTKTRHLCEQCCQLIHALGVAVAPFPKGGRWRVTNGEWISYLCDQHTDERMKKNG